MRELLREVVDLVTDVMQPAATIEEAPHGGFIAHGFDQFDLRLTGSRRTEEDDFYALDGVFDDARMVGRTERGHELPEARLDGRNDKTNMMEIGCKWHRFR